MKADRLVTPVGREAIQQTQMQPTPVAHPVALDMLNQVQDRTTATQHVWQVSSRQEGPLHVPTAQLDMLNQVRDRTTATQHVGQALSQQEALLHAHLARLDMLNQVRDRTTATQHVGQASILKQERQHA